MDRNFRQPNTIPSRPTRGWRKNTGPGEDSLTAAVRKQNTGEITASIAAATTRSKTCLVANCQPFGLVLDSTNSGVPPT